MAEKKGGLKGFFGEFKQFITRGNVMDMAVGVIVGGAFTAIITALSDHILKPVINWLLALIFGKNSLTEIYTFLKPAYVDGQIDLANSIYIDWGAFINAIINFLIIAFVLFCIVKGLNSLANARANLVGGIALGIAGIALCCVNYFIYKKMVEKKTGELLPIIDDNEEKLANILDYLRGRAEHAADNKSEKTI